MVGPGQGRTKRLSRVNGRHRHWFTRVFRWFAETVDGLGGGELGRSKPINEVAPAHITAVLQRAQHWIHGSETSPDRLGEYGLTRHHPMAKHHIDGALMQNLGV